jgi:5'-deoxynucleotidase YfbR-like HD superfamily hydrolase
MSELHWMQTVGGRKFVPDAPDPASIDIEDIAHALSLVCRFGGHTRELYSVAQHSVLVCDAVSDLGGTLEEIRYALLHDASEAYIGDVVWPLKQSERMRGYKVIEDRVMKAILERFGIVGDEPPIVKRADLILLSTEKRDLMRERDGVNRQVNALEANAARDRLGKWHSDGFEPLRTIISPWPSKQAHATFMNRYWAHFEGKVVSTSPRPQGPCTNYSPSWYRGRWIDWHRGHSCALDDGKPRSLDAQAEIRAHGDGK